MPRIIKERRLRFLIALVLATGVVFAQTLPTQVAGLYDALAFRYNAVVVQGNGTTGVWAIQVNSSQFVLADGTSIFPFALNAPITIGNGINAETVTPSQIVCSLSSSCSITATFSKIHGQGEPIISASFGLYEAENYVAKTGGSVIVSGLWASAGGTTAIFNAAPVLANVKVLDNRLGLVTSGGSGSVTGPSSTTVGNVPQWFNTTGTTLNTGLGVVTIIQSPGADTNIPTEKSVRTAIAAAGTGLPPTTGTPGYAVNNGAGWSLGNIVTGGSGALDCSTIPGTCDIVTPLVPLQTSFNTFTGLNVFYQLRIPPQTFVSWVTCASSTEGTIIRVSDSSVTTIGGVIANGGTSHVTGLCDGTHYRVLGAF